MAVDAHRGAVENKPALHASLGNGLVEAPGHPVFDVAMDHALGRQRHGNAVQQFPPPRLARGPGQEFVDRHLAL
jgi:hypothetical protein